MSPPRRSRWLPILLSALAWPGAGQFLQKRWVWGTVYAVAFALFVGLSLVLLVPLAMRMVQAWLGGVPPPPIDWKLVLRPPALATGIYLANLYDVWWFDFKAARTPPPISSTNRPAMR